MLDHAGLAEVTGRSIDRALQVHGGMGLSDDVPLATMYAQARAMRIFDGPDEVRLRTATRRELKPYLS